ncbi:MAG: contractile injection system protein, VgrG/Pvc8 family, partial [Hydrogeniiclostridium sp.]
MASMQHVAVLFSSAADPEYGRVEQYRESDVAFLSRLSKNAGISLKVSNRILVLFDQASYEQKPAVLTVKRGDGSYLKYDLSTGTADAKYASCRVRYADPATGKVIEGVAYAEDYKEDAKNNQQLEISAKVTSIAEAQTLAAARLRLHNKY